MRPVPQISRLSVPEPSPEPFTDAEISMILDTYMYTDYPYAKDGQSLREIVSEMPDRIDTDEKYYKEYEILRKACENPCVGDLKICAQSRNMGYDSGTNACTFMTNDRKNVYVAFRGTADGEWLDNGLGLSEKETKQQKQALKYFEEVMEKEEVGTDAKVITTGHSKGGNKVQFITMESTMAFLIDQSYAVDGQGFSKKAVAEWKERYGEEGYEERRQKLYGINGENDFVSTLGICIIPASHIRYVETPGEKSDFAAFHDITRMFASGRKPEDGSYDLTYHGRKNKDVPGRGALGNYVSGLSEEFMKLPSFVLDGCAASVMQLAETLGGKKKKGLNGETVKLTDLAEFQTFGLPAIVYSLLMKKDGTEFLENAVLQDEYSYAFGTESNIRVSYPALLSSAEYLKNTAAAMGLILPGLGAASLALPFTIDGLTVRKYRIEEEVVKLRAVQLKLAALALIEEQTGELYRRCDEEITAWF